MVFPTFLLGFNLLAKAKIRIGLPQNIMTINILQVSVILSWRAAQAGDLGKMIKGNYHLKKHQNNHLPLLYNNEIAGSHLEYTVEPAVWHWGREIHWTNSGASLFFPPWEGIPLAQCMPTCPLWGTLKRPVPVVCRSHQIKSPHLCCAASHFSSSATRFPSPCPSDEHWTKVCVYAQWQLSGWSQPYG